MEAVALAVCLQSVKGDHTEGGPGSPGSKGLQSWAKEFRLDLHACLLLFSIKPETLKVKRGLREDLDMPHLSLERDASEQCPKNQLSDTACVLTGNSLAPAGAAQGT